jgi:hypothetical protein
MATLLLSPRYDPESKRVRAAAERSGWSVLRLATRRIPDTIPADPTDPLVFYGEPTFMSQVAATRGIALLRPTLDWLAALPEDLRRRSVHSTTLADATRAPAPAFVKPAAERKTFPAAIYPNGAALATATADLPGATPVLVAEPVEWEVEVRCFLHEDTLLVASPYLRTGRLAQTAHGAWPWLPSEQADVTAFVADLARDPRVCLPAAVALDIGRIGGRGWAVVELNSAWAAGLYGCDPALILPALARASVPRARLTVADRPWVDPAPSRPGN